MFGVSRSFGVEDLRTSKFRAQGSGVWRFGSFRYNLFKETPI